MADRALKSQQAVRSAQVQSAVDDVQFARDNHNAQMAQAQIHLAELGHPICGEKVYNHQADGTVLADTSGAPRLALHAAELGLVHPVTGQSLRWEMPLTADLSTWLDRLRARG